MQSAAMTESSTSMVQQVQDFGTARWEAEITIRPLDFQEAKVFQAFIASLRGVGKTFRFGDPQQNYTTNVPVCATLITVNAGATIIGIQNTSNYELVAGSHFSLNNRLHMLLETANDNATTSCEITPPIRTTTGAMSLDVTNPTGLWRLASNQVEWNVGVESLHSFTIACIEVIT